MPSRMERTSFKSSKSNLCDCADFCCRKRAKKNEGIDVRILLRFFVFNHLSERTKRSTRARLDFFLTNPILVIVNLKTKISGVEAEQERVGG